MEKNAKLIVIGKAKKFIIYAPLIFSSLAIALIIWFSLGESVPFNYIYWGMSGLLGATAITAFIVTPRKIIFYDSDGKTLLVRGGKTLFSSFKIRTVHLSQIESVYANLTNLDFYPGFLVINKGSLNIKTHDEVISAYNVKRPKKVCERINQILAEFSSLDKTSIGDKM